VFRSCRNLEANKRLQEGEAIVFLFPHLTFLLLFPFYNPNTIRLQVLMVLSIGGIANAMFLPVVSKIDFRLRVEDY
jgi:hypothetical protein